MAKKIGGLSIYLLVYALEMAMGVFLFFLFMNIFSNPIISILFVNVITTVFVWMTSLILKSASIYDPYWSVQPLCVYLLLLIYFNNWNLGTILLLIALAFYSIRLTVNFAIGFNDIHYIDWRYKQLKEKSGIFFQFVNLFGICMMPTLLVYLATIPLIIASYSMEAFHPIQILGLSIIVIGTLLELISDIQMKQFIKTRTDRCQIIDRGLWKYSRHPNYLGEIMIWYGVAFTVILPTFTYWYYFIGAILITLLFIFISIPLEEKHMKTYKPNFDLYKQSTSPLFIWLKKNKNN